MSHEERRIGGKVLELTSLDRVLFPEDGITKGDVIDYYEKVAGVMLPHLRGRFISMHRYPDGIGGEGFFQKEAPDYFPEWIRIEKVEKKDGWNHQVVVDDAATLVYLAQQGCLTPHPWMSRAETPHHPDRMVFDFDPPGSGEGTFGEVRWAARELRSVLQDLGLTPFVMTSGSRGLHVYLALDGKADFDEAKAFSRAVADLLAERHPERLTTEIRKAKRGERIFIDYLRNEYAQTSVAPYALRARPGAPVATPLDWEELSASGMGPRRYSLQNLFRRLGAKEDPWAGLQASASGLAEARRKLDSLASES